MLKRWRTSPNEIFVMKLHHHQIRSSFGLDSGHLEELFPGVRFIFIRRADKENQAISLCKAKQTNQWIRRSGEKAAEAVYDFECILKQHKRVIEEESEWLDYFERSNIEPLTVWYRDLLREYVKVLARISHQGAR